MSAKLPESVRLEIAAGPMSEMDISAYSERIARLTAQECLIIVKALDQSERGIAAREMTTLTARGFANVAMAKIASAFGLEE